MLASLEDFFPLYRVRNTVIDVPPNYHVSFLFGKAAITKGGREYTGWLLRDREVYILAEHTVVDRQGKDVTLTDPDFDK